MSLKDSTGTIVIVLTVVALYAALAFQSRSEFSQTTREIGDLRERITRVETVINERLPRSPVPLQTPAE